jgi:predicted GTPase
VKMVNPTAIIVEAGSPITVEDEASIKGKRVLVVEDGPTLTHGEMSYGAGAVAAKQYGAAEIIDPVPYGVGSIKETFEKYRHIKNFLPAMGYTDEQIKDLQDTIDNTPADVVVSGTPIDLNRVLKANKPIVRVFYRLEELSEPDLEEVLAKY